MKTPSTIFALFLITAAVFARQISQFLGWDKLVSTDIVVLRYGMAAPATQSFVPILNGAKFNVPIDVLYVLKGTNRLTQLQTSQKLTEGENYLVFGYYDGNAYQAMEDYSIISLRKTFSTNEIAGKPCEEQIQILFKRRIDNLNQEIRSDKAEKQRLEEAIKK